MRTPLVALLALAMPFLAWPTVTSATHGQATGASTPAAPAASASAGAAVPSRPIALPGLRAAASVDLDEFGVPLVTADSFADAVRCEGYLHARDRFVQMDLLRRLAAGELAELLGPLAVPQDKQQRVMRGRAAARAAFDGLDPAKRALLEAYAEGVNAGLASLAAPPPEYKFLQVTPAPWRPEDTFLIALSMCAMLNDGARIEASLEPVCDLLPAAWIAYLRSPVSRWNAPVVPDPEHVAEPLIPTAEALSLRPAVAPAPASSIPEQSPRSRRDEADTDATMLAETEVSDPASALLAAWVRPRGAFDAPVGSNGWVVAGAKAGGAAAILANDMHLPITVPSIWYRISLVVRGTDPMRLDGVSLPGVPSIVSGSNGRVAWGFTNVEGDFIDFVVVEPDPTDATRYRVPGGTSEPFTIVHERIAVRGAEPQEFEIRMTRWGPVTGEDRQKRPLALRWTALEPEGLNLALLDLPAATSTAEALDIAAGWRGPQQNVLVADRAGSIGWTISGLLPKRVGFDGLVPVSWADGKAGWDGFLDGPDRPRIENPPEGWIVTANQRTLPVDQSGRLGCFYDEPDRAHRIRTLLEEKAASGAPISEADCARIQLDTYSRRLLAWRDALLPALQAGAKETGADGKPTDRAAKLRRLVEAIAPWTGETDVDERAVALVDAMRRRFRRALQREILVAAMAAREPGLARSEYVARADRLGRVPALDERFLQIAEARPDHLLPPSERSWDAFYARLAIEAGAECAGRDGFLRWGKANTSSFGHPLASALPLLANKFGLPTHEQPGHSTCVRVASPQFGASDRLVVRVGDEAHATIQTPGGQSADPQSLHYSDLHQSWRDGRLLPLQPGTAAERIEFTPAAP